MKLTAQEWRTVQRGILQLTRTEEDRAISQRRPVDKEYLNELWTLYDKLEEMEQEDPAPSVGEILSISDAAQQWGLDTSTIRQAIKSGRLIQGQDCHRIGKQWAVTKGAMYRLYGDPA